MTYLRKKYCRFSINVKTGSIKNILKAKFFIFPKALDQFVLYSYLRSNESSATFFLTGNINKAVRWGVKYKPIMQNIYPLLILRAFFLLEKFVSPMLSFDHFFKSLIFVFSKPAFNSAASNRFVNVAKHNDKSVIPAIEF